MYLESAIMGCIVGAAGTVIGGILAMVISSRIKSSLPFMAFAGGIMISVVFFDMFSESIAFGGVFAMCGGAVMGGVVFAFISPILSHKKERSLYSVGIMVLIGIAMHNLPEGLAVGSSLVESETMAFSLAILMLAHNIPEGLAVCLPLRLSGMPAAKVLMLALLTGLPTAAGAVIGTAAGTISRQMIAVCISFAGGAMLFISLKELIPAAGERKKALPCVLGLLAGFVMTMFI